jgi:type III secretion protein T
MALDYLELFEKITQNTGNQSVLSLSFLAIGRIAPIISISPFFGARVLTAPVKLAIAVSFLAIILPKFAFTLTTPITFNFDLLCLMGRELIIGTIFGFFLDMPFLITSAAGVFIDHQRGASSLMTNDPTLQNQSSPIGTLYNMILIVLFWAISGPFYVFEALFQSYDLLPPDSFAYPVFLLEHTALYDRIISLLQLFAKLSLQLAMPAFLAILMTDTFLGIINRLAPQVQITFLGMGIKSWFALFMVTIGLIPLTSYMTHELQMWIGEFNKLVIECCTTEQGIKRTRL